MSGFEGLTDTWTSSSSSTSTTIVSEEDDMLQWTLRELLIYTCPAKWVYAFNVIYTAGILNTPMMALGTIENWMTQNIVPRPQNVFAMFAKVDPEKVRVVFLFQDPYPGFRQDGTPKANGCALEGMQDPALRGLPSVYSKDDIIPASLRRMFEKLIEEYPEIRMPMEGDLSRWYEQGVFMLNMALTCIDNQPKSHIGIWNGFASQILNYLNNLRVVNGKQLIVVIFGKEALKIRPSISSRIIILESAHPSPMSTKYFAQSRFYRDVNYHLQAMGEPEINWQL